MRKASIIAGPPPPDPRPTLRAAGRSDAEISKIHQALDALCYGNPKGLILITAWNEAWNERATGSPANTLSAAEARQLPYGVPDGVEKLHLIDPDRATPDVQELLRHAKDLFLHHAPMSDYRVLAAWVGDEARRHPKRSAHGDKTDRSPWTRRKSHPPPCTLVRGGATQHSGRCAKFDLLRQRMLFHAAG